MMDVLQVKFRLISFLSSIFSLVMFVMVILSMQELLLVIEWYFSMLLCFLVQWMSVGLLWFEFFMLIKVLMVCFSGLVVMCMLQFSIMFVFFRCCICLVMVGVESLMCCLSLCIFRCEFCCNFCKICLLSVFRWQVGDFIVFSLIFDRLK